MVLSDKVLVGTGGIHGNGWFASVDIEEGEPICWTLDSWEHDSRFWFNIEEVRNWSTDRENHSYMIREDIYFSIPEDRSIIPDISDEDIQKIRQELLVNHSCEPNAWYRDNEHLVARRKIVAGEEITYDYAMTEAAPFFSITCECGKSLCRGTVSGQDYKLPELQERYGTHFMDHILRLQGRTPK